MLIEQSTGAREPRDSPPQALRALSRCGSLARSLCGAFRVPMNDYLTFLSFFVIIFMANCVYYLTL